MKKRIASLLLIALLLVAMLPVTAQAAANEITVYIILPWYLLHDMTASMSLRPLRKRLASRSTT